MIKGPTDEPTDPAAVDVLDWARSPESLLGVAQRERIRRFLPVIRKGYRLRWLGTHGAGHWARVLVNGLMVAAITGADLDIVVMFSLFHDARRVNDLYDPPHGKRGGALARRLLADDPGWPAEKTGRLAAACTDHTAVRHHADVTIQTCWDADRLDLPRIGAEVDCAYLGAWSVAGQEIIAAATARARAKQLPFGDLFQEPELV